MTCTAIVGARVVDPASGVDAEATVVVRDRSIEDVGDVAVPDDAHRIDARGLVLAPGLIDACVFKADAAACLAGGITRVVLMPDQSPPLDDPALIERAQRIGKPHVWVHPLAAATKRLEGEQLAEIGLARLAGAVGVATGRNAIAATRMMHRLLSYARGFDMLVVTHAEDSDLVEGTCATESELATFMGLPAAPSCAEALAISRDVRLAEATGARLHIRQVTTAESIAIIRQARARGVHVSCGVCPAYLILNELSLAGYRTFARLSPPLRGEADRLAIVEAFLDGTIDVLSSSHDPRTQEAKRLPFAEAEPGMVGAETLLALGLTFVLDGRLSLLDLISRLSTVPATLFGLPGGRLAPGEPADLLLFDLQGSWRIDADASLASAGNTPFDGMPVQGKVVLTMKGGELHWV